MQFESEHEQLDGSSADSNRDTAASSADAEVLEHDDKSAKQKYRGAASLKDKLKGQAKVIAGKMTRDDDKVESGRMLKAGATNA